MLENLETTMTMLSVGEVKDVRSSYNGKEGKSNISLNGRSCHANDDDGRRDDNEDEHDVEGNEENNHGRSTRNVNKSSSSLLQCTSHTDDNDNTDNDDHAKNDTNDVIQLKFILVLVLVISAFIVGIGTYWYLNQSEQEKFQETYQDDATKLAQAIYVNVINTFAGLDLLATVMIAHADGANETWPYTTLPHFANQGAKVLSMSASVIVWTMMIVNGSTQRTEWENYAWDHRSIVNETLHVMSTDPNYHGTIPWDVPIQKSIHSAIFDIPYNESRIMAPVWHLYPLQVDNFTAFNWDWLSDEDSESFRITMNEKYAVLSEPYQIPDPHNPIEVAEAEYWSKTFAGSIPPGDDPMEPASDVLYPVINKIDQVRFMNTSTYDLDVVAVAAATFYWRDVMRNVLPTGKQGLIVVFDNPCSTTFTYEVNGPTTNFLGRGDLHDSKYDDMVIRLNFYDLDKLNTIKSEYTGIPLNQQYCPFNISFYPSASMEDQFTTNNPDIFAWVVVLIFVFTSIVFVLYDCQVERRQRIVAARSNAFLSSLFPLGVCDKLLQEDAINNSNNNDSHAFLIRRNHQHYNNVSPLHDLSSKPIADLYPDTTVFFAELCGFTTWSSTRGPDQVFLLLESLYNEFDKVARIRRVFKVETIGDSYVAVAGLPTPMKSHATTMVKFAEDLLSKMSCITTALIPRLGPDTGDLRTRVGLSSGPTTAGIIRGEKSRFQLFGDTVNTASRMESTGQPGRIHCSERTAELIRQAGKDHWLTKRDEQVMAKGKGAMDTYWVQTTTKSDTNTTSSISQNSITATLENITPTRLDILPFTERKQFVLWSIDLFHGLLQDIASYRTKSDQHGNIDDTPLQSNEMKSMKCLPIHEVVDVMKLQVFPEPGGGQQTTEPINPSALKQLGEFINSIATMYRDNPFHNFERVCQVMLSTKNLLDQMSDTSSDQNESNLRIDPLSRFSVLFGTIIQDIDHQGVTNTQLVIEKASMAVWYHNRCVAEQNSFELAWRMLMQPHFSDLRNVIYVDNQEYSRFRQIVINTVMATDIFDQERKVCRDKRWDDVFSEQKGSDALGRNDRKITSLVEKIVHLSDILYTMHSWETYLKWSYHLFRETYIAYIQGRVSDKSPCDDWYKEQLQVFDNLAIPLATKMKLCDAFGDIASTFSESTIRNRNEWDIRGHEIVMGWMNQLRSHDDHTLEWKD